MGSHPVIVHHLEAAAYFARAAEHHRLAADCHERGEFAQELHNTRMAQGHHTNGAFHAAKVASYYAFAQDTADDALYASQQESIGDGKKDSGQSVDQGRGPAH
jgi:hypothetical protein